jgi:transposase-like protein
MWQNQALQALYLVVFFDRLRVKIRDEGMVRNKAVCLTLSVLPDGTRDILRLCTEQIEGAKFWLRLFNKLRNRGVSDILVAVADELKRFPEAIEAALLLLCLALRNITAEWGRPSPEWKAAMNRSRSSTRIASE